MDFHVTRPVSRSAYRPWFPRPPHGLALLPLFPGRPGVPPPESALGSVWPVLLPGPWEFRQRLSRNPAGSTLGPHLWDAPGSWSSLVHESGTIWSNPTQIHHRSLGLDLQMLTRAPEHQEPCKNTDHGACPTSFAKNAQPGIGYSQNRWCFQNSDSTRLIGKYVFQEKIYVSDRNA